MKHTVRSFSVGLLTSAVILLIIFFVVEDTAQTAEDMDAEEMIPYIEEQGYTVLSTEEYVKFSVDKQEKTAAETEKEENTETTQAETKPEKQKEDNDSDTESEETSTEDEETDTSNEEEEEGTETNDSSTYTLTIESGMASSDISSILADQNIIEDASEFNDYLDEHDYSLQVKPGTRELSSDMSFYEIAEAITSY